MLDLQEECASMMQDLSDKINNKHHEVHSHPLLSIFKMAEVEVKMPYNNEAAVFRSSSALLVVLLAVGLFGSTYLFDSWQGHHRNTIKNLYRTFPSRRIATCREHADTPTAESIRKKEDWWPWRPHNNEEKGFSPSPRSLCWSIYCKNWSTDLHDDSCTRFTIANRAVQNIIRCIRTFNGIFVTAPWYVVSSSLVLNPLILRFE